MSRDCAIALQPRATTARLHLKTTKHKKRANTSDILSALHVNSVSSHSHPSHFTNEETGTEKRLPLNGGAAIQAQAVSKVLLLIII